MVIHVEDNANPIQNCPFLPFSTKNVHQSDINWLDIKAYIATDINGIQSNAKKQDVIYNLQGQKVENVKKGIYIKNGHKVFVR